MGSRALPTALSLSVLAALAPGLLGASKPVDLSGMTAGKWREDLDYFARELPRRHKNAFHATPRERFEQEVASLKARADTAHADEMLVGIMKVTALVGDGHTGIRLPAATPFMPITVVTIEGAQRVVRAAGAAAPLVGGRLIRIDDTPLDEVVARIRTILASAESEVLTAAFTPFWLSVPATLHGLGITKRADAARYTVLLDDGTERGAEVSPLAPGIEPDWKAAAASQPLYRQRPGESFWFTWLPESATVYVCWRRYDDLKRKSRDLWRLVDSHPVERIAIDLRQNGGGDFHVGRRHMVDELARRTGVRAYVITGGRTFSAAMKNAIDFREVAGATLVGETIGERPNSYSENDEMTLPHSRLEISYSTRYYTFLPTDALVVPDQEILPTWVDWLAGRDPVMDWILRPGDRVGPAARAHAGVPTN